MKAGKIRMSQKDILDATNNGYDIIRYYHGSVPRTCKSPFRRESNNSFGFFFRNGAWFYKDIATEDVGNAIQYVEKRFGLSTEKARDKILYDFGLGGSEINVSPIKIQWEKPNVEEHEYVFMDFSEKKFGKKHHEFWNIAGVDEARCNKYNCWAVKDAVKSNTYTKKRERIPIGKDEIVFAYYAPEEDGIKLYFPERENYRFLTNISGSYLWNFNDVEYCENLVGQKSMKDLIVTTLFTECVFAVQSENVGLFWDGENPTEVAQRVNAKGKNIFLSYGSDDDGKNKSIKISKALGWSWVNPPNKFLPEVNDVYSLAVKQGLKEVEKMFKNKKII